jgi:hypothetical protein
MDNLEIAMTAVAETMTQTVHRTTGQTPEDSLQQVLIRAPKSSHTRWKQAADHMGISLAEYIRRLADTQAAIVLDCNHPKSLVANNRWGSYCSHCGQQLAKRR